MDPARRYKNDYDVTNLLALGRVGHGPNAAGGMEQINRENAARAE